MREVEQETILSAYIAATGKRNPLEAAHDATELCGLARSLHRLNEAACNYGLTDRQGTRALSLEKSIRSAVERAGLTLNHFNGDPRGYAVYLDLPDGPYNTLSAREHGYGIG